MERFECHEPRTNRETQLNFLRFFRKKKKLHENDNLRENFAQSSRRPVEMSDIPTGWKVSEIPGSSAGSSQIDNSARPGFRPGESIWKPGDYLLESELMKFACEHRQVNFISTLPKLGFLAKLFGQQIFLEVFSA